MGLAMRGKAGVRSGMLWGGEPGRRASPRPLVPETGPAGHGVCLLQGTITRPVTDPRVWAALKLVGADLANGVSVGGVASRLGLSRSRLQHILRAQTGTNFRLIVRSTKLARACELLGNPRLRVKEVAAQCGYANTSSLTREFKRVLTLPPSPPQGTAVARRGNKQHVRQRELC